MTLLLHACNAGKKADSTQQTQPFWELESIHHIIIIFCPPKYLLVSLYNCLIEQPERTVEMHWTHLAEFSHFPILPFCIRYLPQRYPAPNEKSYKVGLPTYQKFPVISSASTKLQILYHFCLLSLKKVCWFLFGRYDIGNSCPQLNSVWWWCQVFFPVVL